MLIEFDCSVQLGCQNRRHFLQEFNDEFDPQIRTADPRFGDFQANGAFHLQKKRTKP